DERAARCRTRTRPDVPAPVRRGVRAVVGPVVVRGSGGGPRGRGRTRGVHRNGGGTAAAGAGETSDEFHPTPDDGHAGGARGRRPPRRSGIGDGLSPGSSGSVLAPQARVHAHLARVAQYLVVGFG